MALYRIYSGAQPTAGMLAAVTLDVGIHTLLQIKSSDTKPMKVKAWGISFNGFVAVAPVPVELIETGTVFATVTAHVTAGIIKIDGEALAGGDPVTNLIPVGTTSTGYDASAEGTVTAGRLFDAQLVAPTNQYIYQWPLGTEPVVAISSALRIRANAAAAANALCWVDVEV